MSATIRPVALDEMEAFLHLVQYAFFTTQDDTANVRQRIDTVDWERLSERTLAAFEGPNLASGLIHIDFVQKVRGQMKKMAGVAAVASYPEYRRTGNVRRLFEELFALLARQGFAVSMLGPFKESFYGRLGYASANATLYASFPPEALAHWDKLPLEEFTVVREGGSEARERFFALLAARPELIPHGHAWTASGDHPKFRQWARDKMYVFIEQDGQTQAVACYQKVDTELKVAFHAARTPRARGALLAFFARHRDQITRIELPLAPDVPYWTWLQDYNQLTLGANAHPLMMRILDVPAALDGMAVPPAEEPLTLEIIDEQCPWNCGAFELAAPSGRLCAVKTQRPARARLDIRALTALLYGSLDTETLALRGWLQTADPALPDRLDTWFPQQRIANHMYF